MSSVIEQERELQPSRETDELISRVAPMMPPPEWLCELDDSIPSLAPPKAVSEEEVFWSTPPRYSLLVSLVPGPVTAAPSARQVWGARLLFGLISCAILALLVFEGMSLIARTPVLRAPSVLVTNSP